MKKQAITLGRIGILLPIATIIPLIGSLAGLASIVLLLISHYNFSKFYEKPVIFNAALTGFIIQIVLSTAGFIMLGIAFASNSVLGLGSGDFSGFDFQEFKEGLFQSTLSIIASLLVLISFIVGYYFIFKAMKPLAVKTGVKYFNTAGLLYFIGAIGIIVFFVGFLVIFVAWILHVIAYFTIQPEAEAAEAPPEQS